MTRLTSHPEYQLGLRGALAAASSQPPPDAVVEWLAQLRLLHGVPFYYLVPDPRMLPTESIRFFFVDDNWLDAMVDGAFSIGRSTSGDAHPDIAIHTALAHRIADAARATRQRRRQARRTPPPPALARPPQSLVDPPPAVAVTDASQTGAPITGFVLRSAVVSGWPGLEVRGYASGPTALPILRFDRMSADVLLCLFDGRITKVTFSEPAEALHFGFELPNKDLDPYKKLLKYVDNSSHVPGSEIDGVFVDAPFRPGARRVIDVAALKDQVKETLTKQHLDDRRGMSEAHLFTPAEFALELVQGVQEVDFEVDFEVSP
ncbi:MAG TPA: hypothetical protein VHT30_00120 [Acidimicrobiales bacterium]|jgi:hypothetical protein|nr:hypothetical protein [Acidimicrobiales bacterium]